MISVVEPLLLTASQFFVIAYEIEINAQCCSPVDRGSTIVCMTGTLVTGEEFAAVFERTQPIHLNVKEISDTSAQTPEK